MTNFLIFVFIFLVMLQVISFFRAVKQFKRMIRIFNKFIDHLPEHIGAVVSAPADPEVTPYEG